MITSRQNVFIKTVKSLYDKKNRDKSGLYVVEGVKAVKEAIFTGVKIYAVICTEKGSSLLDKPYGERYEIVSDDVFDSISDAVSPQGVMGVLYKDDKPLKKPDGNCLLLDGVSDPANVGAIIRTAVATGFKDIYLAEGSADPYSPKSVRASMSGIFRVNVYFGKREELLSVIDKPIVVADMNGENVFKKKGIGKVCLCIGNEGNGISEEVKGKANMTVSIPMEEGMESLNASVSAGILMYAIKENG